MNDRVWTGEINRDAAIDAEVGFYDTTLRDGEQAVGVVLDPEQKLEIARGLDELGIERIEAGFPRVSADDERAFRLVLEAGLDAEIWGFSRAVPADIEALVELGVPASVVESPMLMFWGEALGPPKMKGACAPQGEVVIGRYAGADLFLSASTTWMPIR